ncbi:MAG: succinate dehydrogenase, hydrophobic membrane anchor protein [Betaproteobacteria bacterium]|nr:succinate dehydrogenase, hydrophobic membrane anchor protein [Betaproteobacteria bacterium]
MVNKIIVGAHYGLKDWLGQRITAAVMAAYTVILLVLLAGQEPLTFEVWYAFMADGFMRFLTFLFILSLMFHAWVGVRDIWMDYVKPTGLRLALHVLTLLALVGYTGWAVSILWRL